jgi:hypothetical protein
VGDISIAIGQCGMTPTLETLALQTVKPHGESVETRGGGMTVTVERLERAIHIVADMMVNHDMDLMPTIKRLEAERDKLRQKSAHMDYAREILKNGRNKGSNIIEASQDK